MKNNAVENVTENRVGHMYGQFSREVLEKLAIWNNQRNLNVIRDASNKIDEFFSNRFNFIERVFCGNMKNIVDMCEKDYSRNSALDVIYAYSTSKDKDVMNSCTWDIIDIDTNEVLCRKYRYEEIVSLVNMNIFPVWDLYAYKIYDIETLEIIGEVKSKDLRDIYNEILIERENNLEE